MLKVADAEKLPPHILLGSDAFQYARQAETQRASDADRWQAVSVSTHPRVWPDSNAAEHVITRH